MEDLAHENALLRAELAARQSFRDMLDLWEKPPQLDDSVQVAELRHQITLMEADIHFLIGLLKGVQGQLALLSKRPPTEPFAAQIMDRIRDVASKVGQVEPANSHALTRAEENIQLLLDIQDQYDTVLDEIEKSGVDLNKYDGLKEIQSMVDRYVVTNGLKTDGTT